MTGVFGAGVASAFEDNDIYPHLDAIYAASAGALSGAYLLSHQTKLGSSIYWENLQENFISFKNFFVGVWQRFEDEFIKRVPQEKLKDAYNIDHLISVIKKEKKLDIQKIISQQIPLYIKLYNLDSHQIEYMGVKKGNLYEIFKAAMNAFPYIHEISCFDGKEYIDAAIIDIIGLDKLLKLIPNGQIIVILNSPEERKLRYRWKNMIEGKFMKWMFNKPEFYELFAKTEDRLKIDIEKIKNNSRIHLIAAPKNMKVCSRTTGPRELKKAWQIGYKEGEKIMKKLKLTKRD